MSITDVYTPPIQINFEKVVTVSSISSSPSSSSSTFNSSLALNSSHLISANESYSTNGSAHGLIGGSRSNVDDSSENVVMVVVGDDDDNDNDDNIQWAAMNEDNTIYQPIQTAPVYLYCCALSLAGISAFLRAGFVMKFILMIICVGIQGCVLHFSDLYRSYDVSQFTYDRYV